MGHGPSCISDRSRRKPKIRPKNSTEAELRFFSIRTVQPLTPRYTIRKNSRKKSNRIFKEMQNRINETVLFSGLERIQ